MSVEQEFEHPTPVPVEWQFGRTEAGSGPAWTQARDGLRSLLDQIEESQDDAQFSAELMALWFQLSTWPDNQPFTMTVRGVEYWIRLRSEASS